MRRLRNFEDSTGDFFAEDSPYPNTLNMIEPSPAIWSAEIISQYVAISRNSSALYPSLWDPDSYVSSKKWFIDSIDTAILIRNPLYLRLKTILVIFSY